MKATLATLYSINVPSGLTLAMLSFSEWDVLLKTLVSLVSVASSAFVAYLSWRRYRLDLAAKRKSKTHRKRKS